MHQIIEYLQSIHPLSPALVEYLYAHLKYKKVCRKEYVLKAGHVARSVYFIETGLLRAFYMKGDREVTSWFMKEDDVSLSIESFYGQTESYEYIQALEDCSLYYIDYQELEAIYRHYPEFNALGRLLTIRYHIHWVKQLYSLRMQTAEERYIWLLLNQPELLSRVPAKYIASYLDITEVTLSKIRAKIAGKGK